MASEHEGKDGRTSHPLVGVATDGVGLGYQAAELVVEGMRESLRLKSGRGTTPRGGHPPSGPAVRVSGPPPSDAASAPLAPSGLVSDVAAIVAEILTRAGAVADEVAQTLSHHSSGQAGSGSAVAELSVQAVAGETATLDFAVWNTGATALRQVNVYATDLIGAGRRIPDKAVSFSPSLLAHVGPGKSTPVKVEVAVPARTPAGTYRGLVQAEPGDTSAVIELLVSAPGEKPSKGGKARGGRAG
jgi:alpha-galactosidase-like protein